MSDKRLLIVDEDEVILSLLQKSLLGIRPDCQIVATSEPEEALKSVATESFNAILIDIDLLTARDLHFVDAIRLNQDPLPFIIGTTFYYKEAFERKDKLPVHYVLGKPIDSSMLKEVVFEIFGDPNPTTLKETPMPEQLYSEANLLIEQLRTDTNARCILISDMVGRIILKVGNIDDLPIDSITSLLSGGIATLLEAGRNIDNHDVINLAYREGKQSDLYAINIRSEWLLILVIDRGDLYERLGTVWYYARKTTLQMGDVLAKIKDFQPISEASDKTLDQTQAYSDELDKLFG